jgi:membrane protein implicated in regulation of membrane protease activity
MSWDWRTGYVMYWASHDLYWSLDPDLTGRLPVWMHQLSAWVTLVWEIGFPVLAVMRGTRTATLALGVVFHLGTLLTLDVGNFALYSIVCYTAFAPWERLRRPRPEAAMNESQGSKLAIQQPAFSDTGGR